MTISKSDLGRQPSGYGNDGAGAVAGWFIAVGLLGLGEAIGAGLARVAVAIEQRPQQHVTDTGLR